MKLILAFLLLLGGLFAQTTGSVLQQRQSPSPSSPQCEPVGVVMLSLDGNAYLCAKTNTWQPMASGGSGQPQKPLATARDMQATMLIALAACLLSLIAIYRTKSASR